jgi:hypothetical protein
MNGFKINLIMSDGRDCSVRDEKRGDRIFYSPVNATVNLEPDRNVNGHHPCRSRSLTECSYPAFNLLETNLTRVWRTI